jgi:GTPase SAR1 family protein
MKMVLLGSTGAGKSSFLLRLADGTFSDQQISTIGVDFVRK